MKFSDYRSCIQCEDGYQYNSETNQCIQHQCTNSQYRDISSGTCKPCGQNCSQCTQEQCTTCINTSYELNQQNPKNCRPCSIPNCQYCNLNGTCEVCQSTYYKTDDNKSCIKCYAVNCIECHKDGPQYCEKCIQNYKLFEDTKECVCQEKNCNKCLATDGLKCEQCSSNYKLNNYKCVPNCTVNNCDICEEADNTKCKQCKSSFKLNELTQCVIKQCKVQNCYKCNENSEEICEQCNQNYVLSTEQKCQVKCSVQYCQTCKSENSQICEICQLDYQLTEQNTCKRKCSKNCAICNDEDSSVCKQCDSNYKLEQNQCKIICDVQNCQKCDETNIKICLKCQDNYYINSQNKTCEKCQISNCKECLWKDSQLCQTCLQEHTIDKKQKLCKKFTKEDLTNKIKFSQSLKNDGYNINLEFSKNLIIDPNDKVNDLLQISIADTNQDDIQYSVSDDRKSLSILVKTSKNIKDQQLLVEFKDEYFQKENQFSDKQYKFQLETYVVVSEQQKQAAAQAGQVNKKVSSTLLASLVAAFIAGNSYVLINTIDITSFIYYLLYVDVRYPDNVKEFCKVFKDFQFPFIPNIFAFLIDPDYTVPSPKKFMEMGADAYFLKNGGQGLTISMGIMLIYAFAKFFSKYMPIQRIKNYFIRKVDETWEYSGFFDMIGTSYIYVLVGVLLQFYDFDSSDPNRSSYINFSLFTLNFLFVVYFPIYLIRIIKQTKNLASNKYFQKKYSSVVGGLLLYDDDTVENFKKESQRKINFQNYFQVLSYKRKLFQIQLSAYSTGIQYIRKFTFCFFLVYFHSIPPIQLMIFIFLSLLMQFYYFYVRPYESMFDNIKNGICEIMLIGFEVCLMYLIDDQPDQTEEARSNVGWIIVSFCSIMIGVHAITMVIELFNIFKFIFVKVVFAICINKFKKITKNNLKLQKIRKESDMESMNNNQNQDQQTDNILSAKKLNPKSTISTQRGSQNFQVLTSPVDSPYLQKFQSSSQFKKSSQFFKDDTMFKINSTIDKVMLSPAGTPESSNFFKNKVQLLSNGSSFVQENSVFSSIQQDKINDTLRLPEIRSDISSKYQGSNVSNLLEMNKIQSEKY